MARIAFVLPDLGGGGAERVAVTLVNAIVGRGHEVDLVLMQRKGELLSLVDPKVLIFDLGARRARNVVRPLIRYLRKRRPDAVQVSMWPLTALAIVASRLCGHSGRIVVSDHAILSDHFSSKIHWLLRLTTRLFYPLADARIAVSAGAAADLAKLSGLARSCFSIVPNPVAFPAKVERSEAVEALWGAASKRILTVGKLKAEKDQALLIRAFSQLPEMLDAKLMIVGSGDLERELRSEAASHSVSDRVIFAGYVTDPWPYYASADLFALPSREESFGNVLVEALYAGLSIVSTDTIGAREVLEDGRWGRITARVDADAFAKAMIKQLEMEQDREGRRNRALALSGENSLVNYLDLLLAPDGQLD